MAAVWIFAAMCQASGPEDRAIERDRDRVLQAVSANDISEEEVFAWLDFAEAVKLRAKSRLSTWQRARRAILDPWVLFGLTAQAAFMFRFILQIIASERLKRSHVPVGFWYFSLLGGVMLLIYATFNLRDPVFMFGQGLGCIIYVRNLVLIQRASRVPRP